MARSNASGGGCGCLLFVLVGLPLGAFGVGLAAVVLAAPAVVPYLLVADPAQFAQNRLEWLVTLAASPLVALVLVGVAGRGRPPGARRAAVRRSVLRAGILLGATTLTALGLLLRGNDAHGPGAAAETLTVFGGTAVAALVVLVALRLRDRWFRPELRVEPVTVETVRAAAAQADRTLRQVRAENQRVSRLARAIEAQLEQARSETDFVCLCDLHHESFGCANGAYRSYKSAERSLQTMARILLGVRAALTPWMRPPRNAVTGRRERPDRHELKAAASSLSASKQQLHAEVQRGLTLVRTLNANTARLKHAIRDNCGERGRRWYQELEMRIQAARSRDQRSPQAARP